MTSHPTPRPWPVAPHSWYWCWVITLTARKGDRCPSCCYHRAKDCGCPRHAVWGTAA